MKELIKSFVLKIIIPVFDKGRSKNSPHKPDLDTRASFHFRM